MGTPAKETTGPAPVVEPVDLDARAAAAAELGAELAELGEAPEGIGTDAAAGTPTREVAEWETWVVRSLAHATGRVIIYSRCASDLKRLRRLEQSRKRWDRVTDACARTWEARRGLGAPLGWSLVGGVATIAGEATDEVLDDMAAEAGAKAPPATTKEDDAKREQTPAAAEAEAGTLGALGLGLGGDK